MMFESFRERLQLVQHDFTTGFKTLGEKSRDDKVKRRPRFEETLPHFSTALEILHRYEESWFLLHKRTKECSEAAEAVDGDIVMLSAHWERRRTALTQLQEQLQSLPAFTAELDAITASIAHLEGDFEEMESRLVFLESLCCHCEQQSVKQQHINQLEIYKKKKWKEVELLEMELNSEHAQKVAALEQAMQQKQKARQKVYEEAFNQDMVQYLSTGHLQHREPAGVDVDVRLLDQMTVTNLSDQEALDDFLNSTSEDVSTESSLTSASGQQKTQPLTQMKSQQLAMTRRRPAGQRTGPDLTTCSSESLNQDPPTKKEEEEENDEPVVQPDEEDIQPDMALIGLQDDGTHWGSDDSDSGLICAQSNRHTLDTA
ncbi:dysbindin-A-like isoform 1-T1 [Pholidichthys leucotaenia]